MCETWWLLLLIQISPVRILLVASTLSSIVLTNFSTIRNVIGAIGVLISLNRLIRGGYHDNRDIVFAACSKRFGNAVESFLVANLPSQYFFYRYEAYRV